MNNKGILIALDASSKEIGFTLWDKEKDSLIEIDHYTLDPTFSLLEKAKQFKELLQSLMIEYPQINEFVIEEAFVAMYGVSSSAATTATLNQINALYQYIAFEEGLKVNLITVQQARKFAFPGKPLLGKAKSGGISHKEQVFAFVLAELGMNELTTGRQIFPTKTISKGKRKGEVVFEDYALDMSDSYVVCKGFVNKRKAETKK